MRNSRRPNLLRRCSDVQTFAGQLKLVPFKAVCSATHNPEEAGCAGG
jgi:hypothetical protein